MLKALFLYVKYPSVAGIIGVIWIGSGLLILEDKELPVLTIVILNIAASIIIGLVGFRSEKK